jgi:CMP-N-acetylneuraminic acid synthetase
MRKRTNLLCFIPARSGSTRIKNKNLKKINNKTLVEITIEQAIKSKIFYRKNIILSSDDNKILNIGKKFKICISKRSKKNSQTNSKIEYAILETLNKNKFKDYTGIVLLQTTSPLRKISTIRKFVKFCTKNKLNHCLTVSQIFGNLSLWSHKYFNPINKKRLMTQFIKPFLYENSLAYFVSKDFFLARKKMYPKINWIYCITNKYESLDINDYNDFKICKILMK